MSSYVRCKDIRAAQVELRSVGADRGAWTGVVMLREPGLLRRAAHPPVPRSRRF